MNQADLHITQQRKVRSFSADKDDLRGLLELLQERAYGAAEIEKSSLEKREEWDEEKFAQAKDEIEEAFELYITISGTDGRKLTGNISEIFDSPNFPNEIKDVFFDTSTTLRIRYNYVPLNKMILFIDFGRPAPLNLSILPSQETQNESNIEVSGKDATWVNGVFTELSQYVDSRPSTLPWLHRHSVYDLLLWFIGFPLTFWLCYKASGWIESSLASFSGFLRAAVYFYLFIVFLTILRIVFHYARWIWPLTEYQSPKSKSIRHKAMFTTAISAILLPALYDIAKALIL